MSILIVLFGLLSGCLLSVLVGCVGTFVAILGLLFLCAFLILLLAGGAVVAMF